MEWISVDDKMPENGKDVLVAVAVPEWDGRTLKRLDDAYQYHQAYCYQEDIWYDFIGIHDEILEGVTHWMPLPEPPENK